MTQHRPEPADLDEMNVERILALADMIERVEPPPGIDGFNMNYFDGARAQAWAAPGSFHDCGSAGCIGGWCNAAYRDGESYGPAGAAKAHLGLTAEAAINLCYPPDVGVDAIGRSDWSAITPAQAARCLRHLAATGEVDWPRALAEGE